MGRAAGIRRVVGVVVCLFLPGHAWSVPDEAIQVLREADLAFARVAALHYFGEYTRTEHEPSADGPERSNVRAAVWLEREATDALLGWKVATLSPTAYGPEQPLIRAAWDGHTVSLLYPTRSMLRTYEGTLGRLSMVTEFQRARVLWPYIELRTEGGNAGGSLMRFAENTASVELVGEENTGGVACRRVRIVAKPGDGPMAVSSSTINVWIGVEDGLLRRAEMDWVFGGTRYVEQWSYRGMSVSDDLAEDLFQPWDAPGFGHVHTRADGTEEDRGAVKNRGRDEPARERVERRPPEIGEPAPDVELKRADDSTFRFGELKGKAVLVDFWGTWCGPCIAALPDVQKLHERFEKRGLVVLGVSVREPSTANPAKFLEMRGITYETAVKGEDAAALFGVRGYPHVFLVDPEGVLRGSWTGYSKQKFSEIAEAIERVLE